MFESPASQRDFASHSKNYMCSTKAQSACGELSGMRWDFETTSKNDGW